MGSEAPRGSVGGADFAQGKPKLIGGDQSAIGNSTVVKQPLDLTGLANSLDNLGMAVAKNMQQQQKEQEDANRALSLTKLTTQTSLDSATGYQTYQSEYAGKPEDFTKGYLEAFDKQTTATRATITDPKLRNAYDQYLAAQRAKVQLTALDGQTKMFADSFKTQFQQQKAGLDELVGQVPTKDSFLQAMASLDTLYAPNATKLKAAGQEQQALAEIAQEKEKYAKTLILRQAQKDPNAALASLQDPEINQYILDPQDQFSLETKIYDIQNKQLEPFRAQAKDVVANIIGGYATGKDTSGLQGDLRNLISMGVVDATQMHRIQIAQQLSSQFSGLRDQLPVMTDAQFEDALAALNPDLQPGSADVDLDDRREFYNIAVGALRREKTLADRNPLSATAALTGATDSETAALQYVTSKLRNGADINSIKFLNKDTSDQLLGRLNTAASSGNVDAVVALYNEIRQTYGGPKRQVANGYDLADLVLNQLSTDGQNPLARKMVAVYHLLPKDTPLNGSNDLLIRAAMMKDTERQSILTNAGMKERGIKGIDNDLIKNNKLWKTFFSPANPNAAFSRLKQEQKALLLDTMLLTLSSNGYKPTGGVLGQWQTSAETNAINAVIQNYIPYKADSVSGSPTAASRAYDPTRDNPSFFGQTVPSVNTMSGPLGDLINPLTGQRIMFRKKDARVDIKASDILLPKDSPLNGDSVKQFVGSKMNDNDFLFRNVVLPGVNDHIISPKAALGWGKPPEFTDKVNQIARSVGADPNDLMAVMYLESGIKSTAVNSKSKATGLIQKMPFHFKDAAGRTAYQSLPELQQLDDVGRWFSAHKGRLNSPGKTYLAVAAPGVLRNLPENAGPNTIVYPAGSREAKANSMWQDKSGNVTLGKLDALVRGAKQKKGINEGAQSVSALPEGQKMLFEQKMAMAKQNLTLKNNEDLSGVRVYTVMNGREVPLRNSSGKFLEFSFNDIENFRPNVGMR